MMEFPEEAVAETEILDVALVHVIAFPAEQLTTGGVMLAVTVTESVTVQVASCGLETVR